MLQSRFVAGPMRPVLAPEPERAVEPAPPPSFSIVIAAYQAAGTIGEALASAFAQTLPAADVVVSDDGSTDDLAAAVAPYADRVTFLHQANAGEGAAKNAAVREARGEFAVFLDADDVFLPERLEAFAELAASRPDLDILTSDAFLDLDGTVLRRCYDRGWSFEVDDQRGAILERNFVFGLAAVHRSRFLEISVGSTSRFGMRRTGTSGADSCSEARASASSPSRWRGIACGPPASPHGVRRCFEDAAPCSRKRWLAET